VIDEWKAIVRASTKDYLITLAYVCDERSLISLDLVAADPVHPSQKSMDPSYPLLVVVLAALVCSRRGL